LSRFACSILDSANGKNIACAVFALEANVTRAAGCAALRADFGSNRDRSPALTTTPSKRACATRTVAGCGGR
jgi:hypothetical protein